MNSFSRLECHSFQLPLSQPLRTAALTLTERTGVYILAHYDNGAIAIGELAPLQHVSVESLEEAQTNLAAVLPLLSSLEIPTSWEEFEACMTSLEAQHRLLPSVCWAIETLLLDAAAQVQGVALGSFIDARCEYPCDISVNALAHGSGPELYEAILSKQKQGFTTIKIKLIPTELKAQIAAIKQVFAKHNSPFTLRIDANQSLSNEEFAVLLEEIRGFPVEYIEDPCGIEQLLMSEESIRNRNCKLALDESLVSSLNRQSLLESGVFDVAVVKPMLFGGFRRTLAFADQCIANNIAVVLTSSLETPVALLAGLHLAAALRVRLREPNAIQTNFNKDSYAFGFDTVGIFKKNFLSNRLAPHNGLIKLSAASGLGVSSEEALALCK